MSKTAKGIITLFAAAVIEMEFVPDSDVFEVARYLRNMGIPAATVDPLKETITIQPESYHQTMRKLIYIIPNLPDIYKLVWKEGNAKATVYENSGWESEVVPSSSCSRMF